MKLSKGTITQNEFWISYKTNSHFNSLTDLNKLASELSDFLKEKNISHSGDFIIEPQKNRHNGSVCTTLMVMSKCENKQFIPYCADAIG